MSRGKVVLVLGDGGDPLVPRLQAALDAKGLRPLVVRSGRFASCRLTCGETVEVDGRLVHGAIDRSSWQGCLASGFVAEDAEFAEAEARTALFDLLLHPQVVPLNTPDPQTWHSVSSWRHWRDRCGRAGMTVSPLTVGALSGPDSSEGDGVPEGTWLTRSGPTVRPPAREARAAFAASVVSARQTTSTLCIAGAVLAGPRTDTVKAAAAVLQRHGVRFASVTVDERDRLVGVDCQPVVPPAVAERAAEEIAAVMADALARR
jgi:hypothetical protein